MMFLAAQGVLNGKAPTHLTAELIARHYPATRRNHDCWRPCNGQSARFSAFLAAQLLGNDVSGTEAESTRHGSLV
jgi:hypothetical protein